jgi:CRISPR/Cas system-associated exonuclease Cas4 (RecB family)
VTIPQNFQFSQSSLQDFETCRRRFELRYLERLRWPAVETEPVERAERLAQRGIDFHRLVHQHLIGLDETLLSEFVQNLDPALQVWWTDYLNHRPEQLATARLYPELTLSTPVRGYRLQARFDVLARQSDGTFLIIDWKTSLKKPARSVLARRVQTRVYPYVLANAGVALNQHQEIDPARIIMLYWYPHYPREPEEFIYSSDQLQQDERYLSDIIEQIESSARQAVFPKTSLLSSCRYCVYRSWCEREVTAGPLEELDTELASESDVEIDALDWEQIAEIQF